MEVRGDFCVIESHPLREPDQHGSVQGVTEELLGGCPPQYARAQQGHAVPELWAEGGGVKGGGAPHVRLVRGGADLRLGGRGVRRQVTPDMWNGPGAGAGGEGEVSACEMRGAKGGCARAERLRKGMQQG